jgi:hypothetical protein
MLSDPLGHDLFVDHELHVVDGMFWLPLEEFKGWVRRELLLREA